MISIYPLFHLHGTPSVPMHSQSSGSNVHQRCQAATQESRHWRAALGAPARLTFTLCFCPWILFASCAASLREQPSSVEAGLQDCSTREDALRKGELKLSALCFPTAGTESYPLKMYHSVPVGESPALAGESSVPAGTGGQPTGSFGEVHCAPTQQDLSDNQTGHKVCVRGGEVDASFKRIFIRNPWRHRALCNAHCSSLLATSGASF